MDTVSKEISTFAFPFIGNPRGEQHIEYSQFWYNAVCSLILVRPRFIENREIKTGSD